MNYEEMDARALGPDGPTPYENETTIQGILRHDVLDHGYVRLVDRMGTDLSVVNAARVSFDKESKAFEDKDDRLLKFLVRENHTAPFRHAVVSYECYAPLMVKNQWFKHLIGGIYKDDQEFVGMDPFFAWNESSRRYVTENEEFYVPEKWRGKPANLKQGSVEEADVDHESWTNELGKTVDLAMQNYRDAMDLGVAPEQARLFLPAYALYVRWRWTTSLQGAMHFIKLREDEHAQYEIREYATALSHITAVHFPKSIGALYGTRTHPDNSN